MDLKKRWILGNIITFVIGILLVVAGLCYEDRLFSPGVGILVVNGVFYFQRRKYYQDEEKAKEFVNENNDERNQFLSQKSMSWAFLISLYAKYAVSLVLFVLKKDALGDFICYLAFGEMMIMFICYFVASKKY